MLYSPAKQKELVTKLNKRLAKLEPGEVLIKEDLFAGIYHACDGISSTQIKMFIDCPAKYNAFHVAKTVERDNKKIFDLGKAAHCQILEPHVFAEEFVVQPESIKVRRGKAWDEFKAEQNEEAVIITKTDFDRTMGMVEAIDNHKAANEIISKGIAERSWFKRDEETGLIIKCRPDLDHGDALIDLKTCMDASPFVFQRNAKKLGYHISAAMYLDITQAKEFCIVATETQPPHITTAPINFSSDALLLGHLKYRKALNDIATCLLFESWPNYTDEAVQIELSEFERNQLEELTNNQESEDIQHVA